MKKSMKQNILFALGLTAALSLSGCQNKQTDMENEALRQQITQLEQQIQDLEQKISSDQENTSESSTVPAETPTKGSEAPAANPAPDAPADVQAPEEPSMETPASSANDTLADLTAQVAAYEEKVSSAASTGSASEDMNQFFVLKQEEKKIDDELDRYEDELEYLYQKGTLTKDDYRSMERELERLEDRLDAAEDTLEYIYGIDD